MQKIQLLQGKYLKPSSVWMNVHTAIFLQKFIDFCLTFRATGNRLEGAEDNGFRAYSPYLVETEKYALTVTGIGYRLRYPCPYHLTSAYADTLDIRCTA